MAHILLVRHATNDYVKSGRLAGRLAGILLNDEGKAQAAALGERLADAPLRHIYSSPLERTMETAQAVQQHHPHLTIQASTAILEVDYGAWQGALIAPLYTRKMWRVVQEQPSRAYFPRGEAMRAVQVRAVDEIERLAALHPRDTVVLVSHADLIKMVLAHFLGMHLDVFQRIVVSPASISGLQLGFGRPYVTTLNDTAHVQQMERDRKRQATPPSA